MTGFEYTCPKCRYQFEGAGGRDALMTGPTWTIVCLDCGELRDVIVWEKEDLESSGAWSVAIPDPNTKHLTEPKCRKDPEHRVKEWTHPGPCPKCGATMERDEENIIHMD
jgi:hypothetical protein